MVHQHDDEAEVLAGGDGPILPSAYCKTFNDEDALRCGLH